jgi:anthranilate 1,2-dioxygenase small subunit
MVVRIMRDGTKSLFVTGRYLDAYVRNGNSVRLRERVAVCDSSRIDTLLALPL